jgi:hypothetical protein
MFSAGLFVSCCYLFDVGAAGGVPPFFFGRSGARSVWVALRQERNFPGTRLHLLCMMAFKARISL